MKKFIAYFDYLGFKQFIENNDSTVHKNIINNNFRDIENALATSNNLKFDSGRYISDLTHSNINCINFSDTVVFWTNDDSNDSLNELLDVAYKFNWQAVVFFFPARGAIVYSEIEYVDFKQVNPGGGIYNINSVYGSGLVAAHLKAEQQNWAGTVLDKSLIEEIKNRNYDVDNFLNPYAKKYVVPYKNEIVLPEEYVLNIIQGSLNSESFKNFGNSIKENFSRYNKDINEKSAAEKLKNTIKYLESYIDHSSL